MISNKGNRRKFLQNLFAAAGASVIPASIASAGPSVPNPRTVDFVTRFPKWMTLTEYRASKEDFENKDRVVTLISSFKKSKRMIAEEFSFHGSYSVWRVTFDSEASFLDWMTLTEELESHSDERRDSAGFTLEIRVIA